MCVNLRVQAEALARDARMLLSIKAVPRNHGIDLPLGPAAAQLTHFDLDQEMGLLEQEQQDLGSFQPRATARDITMVEEPTRRGLD